MLKKVKAVVRERCSVWRRFVVLVGLLRRRLKGILHINITIATSKEINNRVAISAWKLDIPA